MPTAIGDEPAPATRRAAPRLCRHVIDRGHGQDERPEPAQVPRMAAGGDAQRRRPRRPGLSGLADALVGFRAGGDQVEAGSRRRGRLDGRRPHHRHRPVGLL